METALNIRKMNRYALILTFLLSLVSFPILGMDFSIGIPRGSLLRKIYRQPFLLKKVRGLSEGLIKEEIRRSLGLSSTEKESYI